MAAPKIIVHHLAFTRSQRVIWALEVGRGVRMN